MTHRYQLLYRSFEGGEVLAIELEAEAADVLKAQFKAGGMNVVAINELGPVLNDKPNFDTDEAAAFLAFKSTKTFVEKRGLGEIPFAKLDGRYVYPRKLLEAHIRKHLNPAGKKLASELESEAA